MSVVVYDLTVIFCDTYLSYGKTQSPRTYDQMVQAARSGKQNIAEGSMASGTSKKFELKLVSVARASLAELLEDYQDFLRQRKLSLWRKDDPLAKEVRALSYRSYKSYKTYMSYMNAPEPAANVLVCLVNQTTFLLDRQLLSLESQFLKQGGFTERLYQARKKQFFQQ